MFIKSLALINTVVLARLLTPEDFGLVAIVMSIYAFIEIIKAFGFDVVLIQKQDADKNLYNNAWTLQVLFGLFAATLMALASNVIAAYYEDPRLQDVALFTALLFVLNGCINIGIVDFRKKMNFAKEFRFQATAKILSVSITITLALHFQNYWALVYGMLVAGSLETLLSYYMSPYRPWFTLKKTKEIFNFSSWLMLNNFIFYLSKRTKELIIGKMMGVHYSGLLNMADELSALPMNELVASVNRATFPGYAQISKFKDQLKELYVNTLSSIVILGIPASIGMALVAPVFVPVVLGEQWLEIVPVIQVMGWAYAIFSINSNAMYVFHAVGKPYIPTSIFALQVLILLTLLYLLIKEFGLVGAPLAMLFTAIFIFPFFFVALNRVIDLKLSEYLGAIYRPILAAGIMYLSVSYVIYGNPLGNPASDFQPNVLLLIGVVVLSLIHI